MERLNGLGVQTRDEPNGLANGTSSIEVGAGGRGDVGWAAYGREATGEPRGWVEWRRMEGRPEATDTDGRGAEDGTAARGERR